MLPGRPKLLSQLRTAIRVRHYSLRTEEVYVHWARRYIFSTAKVIRRIFPRSVSINFSATWRSRRSKPCG